MKLNILYIFFLFLLVGCSPAADQTTPKKWQKIKNREGIDTYRVNIPLSLIIKDITMDSRHDTTIPIFELYVIEGDDSIRITIHDFPFLEKSDRIPPQAQVARWKKQLQHLDPLTMQIRQYSHGGFIGLIFEGIGTFEEKEVRMLAWTMQLAPEYSRKNLSKFQADYTIKMVGSPLIMEKHMNALVAFGNSFELIEELP